MEEATINLLPKQTEAWDAFEDPNITELGYGGAAGGGKTRLGCYLAVYIAERYPGSRGAIARKELKTLRLTTLNELFVILAEMGYGANGYKYNSQDGIIKFPNGSEILLLDTAYSAQDPEYTRFGSLTLTWGWNEESNETPEKARNILKTRVGRNNLINGEKIKPFWLDTFNPNKGHIYRDYYKPWKEGTLPAYRKFIRAFVTDNHYLSEAYIKNLERADAITKQRLLYGNFDYEDDPQKLMTYDAIQDLTTNSIPETNEKFLINDIARFGGDKIVLSEWKGLKLTGLEVYTKQNIETTKEKIRNREIESKIPRSHNLSDEGGVGGGVVDGMAGSKGFTGNSQPLDVFNHQKGQMMPANFTNLRSQCYFKLSEMVNNHQIAVELQYFKTNIEGYTQEQAISDLLEELDHIKEIVSNSQNARKAIISKNEIKEMIGRSPDFADIMMMRMWFELREPTQEPKNYWDNVFKKELEGLGFKKVKIVNRGV